MTSRPSELRLIVLRHPRVLAPEICYGLLDVEIASLEETLAHLEASRARWTEHHHFNRSFRLRSSPRTRCQLVAAWFARTFDTAVETVEEMAEMSLGRFEGRRFDALETDPEFRAFMEAWTVADAPEGESVPSFERRVRSLLARTLEETDGTPEVWIAHAGIIRALQVILGQKSWPDAFRDSVPHLEPLEFRIPLPSRAP